MSIKQQIATELRVIVKQILAEEIEPQFSFSSDAKFGDYSTNVAMVAYKLVKSKKSGVESEGFSSPMELAEKIAEQFRIQNSELRIVGKVEVVRPGFINFWVSDGTLINNLQRVSELKSGEVIIDAGKGKKVVVEYSSPNIAKPFTIGHLRSTIIGDAVANLLEATGWEVYRDNHVGDWGTQFGKQIYAIKTWGNEDVLDKSSNPVKDLVALYVKFHEEAEKNPALEEEGRMWFKKLEDGDEEARRLWKKCIDWSWKEFAKIYDQLGVQFTENEGKGYGESYFEDKMTAVIGELKEKGLMSEGENGAQLVFFPDEKYPPLMILKKDGATLYATRDLATDRFRLDKYGKDVVIINEIGAEQSLYMNQLYLTEELLGWVKKGQRIHIKHGLYRFKDGKMSTRKGNVIWLEDVLDQAQNKAFLMRKEIVKEKGKGAEEISEHKIDQKDFLNHLRMIGIGAIKWNDLKRDAVQDIAFDWDDVLNMDGNSGPYMQYAYARTRSVLMKVQNSEFRIQNLQGFVLENEERELLRWLVRFEDVVVDASERYAPNVLCTYLFELAQMFNLFYQKCPILKAEESVREFRLELVAGVSAVIKQGLGILGIAAPESM